MEGEEEEGGKRRGGGREGAGEGWKRRRERERAGGGERVGRKEGERGRGGKKEGERGQGGRGGLHTLAMTRVRQGLGGKANKDRANKRTKVTSYSVCMAMGRGLTMGYVEVIHKCESLGLRRLARHTH